MSAAQHQRQGSGGGGCGGAVGVLIVLGLAIEYWYVSVTLIVLCAAIFVIARVRTQRRARHRPGPRDPWLNEVNVALADLGLVEYARNRSRTVGGVLAEGDIELRTRWLEVRIALFGEARRAHEAEMGLRADQRFSESLRRGYTAVATRDSVLFLAYGRGGLADEILLDEVTRVVARLPIGPALGSGSRSCGGQVGVRGVDDRAAPKQPVLGEIRALGNLHEAGVLTDDEFVEAKSSMLKRL